MPPIVPYVAEEEEPIWQLPTSSVEPLAQPMSFTAEGRFAEVAPVPATAFVPNYNSGFSTSAQMVQAAQAHSFEQSALGLPQFAPTWYAPVNAATNAAIIDYQNMAIPKDDSAEEQARAVYVQKHRKENPPPRLIQMWNERPRLMQAPINNMFNQVQAVHSLGAAGVNFIAGNTQENYEHNRQIDIDARLAYNGGFIDLQTTHAGNFRMGILERSSGMGCVWIATFNALQVLDDPHHPAEIIRWFEENGEFLLQGRQGAFTRPAEMYMRRAGYITRTNYLPRLQIIDNEIRRGDVAILTYMRSLTSAHAVAIQYMGDGQFRVYNEGTLRDMGGYTSSVEEWLRDEMQQEGNVSVVTSLTIINR